MAHNLTNFYANCVIKKQQFDVWQSEMEVENFDQDEKQ